MSELSKNNGVGGFNKPSHSLEEDWDDVESEIFGEQDSVEEADFDVLGSDRADVTLDQIAALKNKVRELERKFSSQENLAGQDDDLLKIVNDLEEAERHEKFSGDEGHQRIAAEKFDEAQRLYEAAVKGAQKSTPGGDDSNSGVLNPERQDEDTSASDIDPSKGIATYKSSSEVTLHNYYNQDKIHTYDVQGVKKVKLFPAAPTDSFVVTFDEAKNQYKIVVNGGQGNATQSKTYYVDPTSLEEKITIASTKVDTSRLTKEQRDKIQVGLDDVEDKRLKKLDVIASIPWPSEGITPHVDTTNTNNSHAGGGGDRAREIAERIDGAAKSGKWADVRKYILDRSNHDWNAGWTQYDDEYMNDAIRKVVTGIYIASGATGDDDPKFIGLLKKIPPEVRQAMRTGVLFNRGEGGESHGDLWDSRGTAERIDASLKSETGEFEPSPSKEETKSDEKE